MTIHEVKPKIKHFILLDVLRRRVMV